MRARGEPTNLSQSWDGAACSDLDVRISTRSPCCSREDSGASLPLTRAPIVRLPTSVCTAYAKSTGVDPVGRAMTSPLGVNTYTSAVLI